MRSPAPKVLAVGMLFLLGGCGPDSSTDPSMPDAASDATDATAPSDANDVPGPLDAADADDTAAPPDVADGDGPETRTDTADADSDLVTIRDYPRCTSNAECPAGSDGCVKWIPLNAEDADGKTRVPIRQVFPRLGENEGICTQTCTKTANRCDSLSVNGSVSDPAPHVCQVVVAGQAPYPASPPEFPFDDELDPAAIVDGQIFGAICRPPFQLDPAVDDALCTRCKMPAGCPTGDAMCWNPATDAPAADGESGTCLAPCQTDSDCPLGFACDASDGSGNAGRSYCRPLLDTCTKCRDHDRDGFGTGRCRDVPNETIDAVTAHDCDDRNPNAYYDPNAMEHPFPEFCGQQDYNCNGLSDATEQVGAGDYGKQHCNACHNRCDATSHPKVANGTAQCQSVGNSGSFCLPECADDDGDGDPDYADCDGKLSNGCERKIDDPDRIFYRDADGDGVGDDGDAKFACRSSTAPAGYVADKGDCDDQSDAVFGGASPADEVCDGLNNDCDGDGTGMYVDESDELAKSGRDCQSNLAGACRPGTWTCRGARGWFCEPKTKPSVEMCGDGVDNDCDGKTDELWDATGSPPSNFGYTKVYRDCDGDGWGTDAKPPAKCPNATTSGPLVRYGCPGAIPEGFVPKDKKGDCRDGDPAVSPGAAERCSTPMVDDDCDGSTNEGGMPTVGTTKWYLDKDADGYGTKEKTKNACDQPPNTSNGHPFADQKDDCDDGEPLANPGRTERCETKADGTPKAPSRHIDNDCDGDTQDGVNRRPFYIDRDGDDYGFRLTFDYACHSSGDYRALQTGDCNERDASVHPGASEVCNNEDDDCNGTHDDGCPASGDLDIDGSSRPRVTQPRGPHPANSNWTSKSPQCQADGYAWTRASIKYNQGSWPVQEVDVGCESLRVIPDNSQTPLAYSLYNIRTYRQPIGGNFVTDSSIHTYDGAGNGAGPDRTTFSCDRKGEAIYKLKLIFGDHLDRVEFYCRDLSIQGSAPGGYRLSQTVTTGRTGGFGGQNKPNTRTIKCQSDEIAVGLRSWTGGGEGGTLRAIALLCKKVSLPIK